LQNASAKWKRSTGLVATGRNKHVEKHLPVFALLTCDVFCWVTEHGSGQNTSDVARLHGFVKRAYGRVLNRSEVTLFLFVRRSTPESYDDLGDGTTEQLVEIYLKRVRERIHIVTENYKAEHFKGEYSELKELFASIVVVPFPTKPNEYVRMRTAQGRWEMQRDEFSMSMYKAEMGEIKRRLCDELESQAHLKTRLFGNLFNKAKWLSMVPDVVKEMSRNNYVSMAKLEVQTLFSDLSDSLFADVIKLFSERVSWPILDLSSPEAMKRHVLDAFEDAVEHSARLIVGKRLLAERDDRFRSGLPEEYKNVLKPALADCLRYMTNCVPCSCQTDAPRDVIDKVEDFLRTQRLVCGQPKMYHSECKHVSVSIPGRWFGRKDGEWPGGWDGSYADDFTCSGSSTFEDKVFEHASFLLGDLSREMSRSTPSPLTPTADLGNPIRLRGAAMNRLHAWLSQRPTKRHKRQSDALINRDPALRLLSSCFLCTQNLPQDHLSFGGVVRGLFGQDHKLERIDLCQMCDKEHQERSGSSIEPLELWSIA